MRNALAPGFADPVFDAQEVFRAAMMALARPGLARSWPAEPDAPHPLTPGLAAIALALADPDAPLWLDAPLAAASAVAEYLRFHTGARIVADPAEAAFALVSDPEALPSFADFAQGSAEYPDRSTTLVIAVQSFARGPTFALEGPGIRGSMALGIAPVPADFAERLRRNNALFPRGVDCLLVCGGSVLGIPRSARVSEAR